MAGDGNEDGRRRRRWKATGDGQRVTMEMTDGGWPWRREEATAMEGNNGRRAADDDDNDSNRMDEFGCED